MTRREGTQVIYVDDTTKEHDSWEDIVRTRYPFGVPTGTLYNYRAFVSFSHTYIYIPDHGLESHHSFV